jgi:siroheme synthase
VTLEALASMERAQKLLYLVADPLTEVWIRERNPTAESLAPYYAERKRRDVTYSEIVQRILSYVRQGLEVTAAFYGHPGVFADPTHAAIRLARRDGYRAVLLPGISAEACLFADLDLDPGDRGCQSYEATDFLNREPRFDPRCPLILLQVSIIGEDSIANSANEEGLQELAELLQHHYPGSHEVVIYQASWYPVCHPIIRRLPLKRIPKASVPMMATLYVPPRRQIGRSKRA